MLNNDEILELYRKKKTPEGRRECIWQIAKENKVPAREIAEYLLQCGEQVDGRLVNREKMRLTQDKGWNPYAAEIRAEKPNETETSGEPTQGEEPAGPDACMTVGILRDLLTGVVSEARIQIKNGQNVRRLTMTASFDHEGEREFCVIMLET